LSGDFLECLLEGIPSQRRYRARNDISDPEITFRAQRNEKARRQRPFDLVISTTRGRTEGTRGDQRLPLSRRSVLNRPSSEIKFDAARRIEEGWLRLLQSTALSGDLVTVDDVHLVIRYLYKRVADPGRLGQRQPGCLKLNQDNLFNVARFVEDLCEARSIMGRYRGRSSERPSTRQIEQHTGDIRRQVEVPTTTPDPVPVDEATSRFMTQLADRKAHRVKGAVHES